MVVMMMMSGSQYCENVPIYNNDEREQEVEKTKQNVVECDLRTQVETEKNRIKHRVMTMNEGVDPVKMTKMNDQMETCHN